MMCPHCGKAIPDGADKCPLCGKKTDFARRSHYRESDSPLELAIPSGGVSPAALSEAEARFEEKNAALREELAAQEKSSRRSAVLSLCALVMAALCLGLSLSSSVRSRKLSEAEGGYVLRLQTAEATQKELQEQLSQLQGDMDALERELSSVKEAVSNSEEQLESQVEDSQKTLLELQERLNKLWEQFTGWLPLE